MPVWGVSTGQAGVTRHGHYTHCSDHYKLSPSPRLTFLSSLCLMPTYFTSLLWIFLGDDSEALMINAWILSLTQSLPQIYILCLQVSRSPTQAFNRFTSDLTCPTYHSYSLTKLVFLNTGSLTRGNVTIESCHMPRVRMKRRDLI